MRSSTAPVPVSRLIIAAVSHCQDLVDRRAVTRAADEPRAFQRDQLEAKIPIQSHDSIGRLIRNHYWAWMQREPARQPSLVLPREVLLGILGEFDIVGWISI